MVLHAMASANSLWTQVCFEPPDATDGQAARAVHAALGWFVGFHHAEEARGQRIARIGQDLMRQAPPR